MDGFVIRTPSILLRPASMEDVGALYRLWREPAVRRHLWDDEEIPRARAEAAVREAVEGFGRHGFGLWVAERVEDGGPVGFCGLRHLDGGPEVEVLYGVSPPEWGRGLATEMAQAMLRYGFESAGLARVVGIADAENAASRRVLEKVGMTRNREEARYEIRAEDFRRVEPTTRG